jgi:hypothetical protein
MFEVLVVNDRRFDIVLLVPQLDRWRKVFKLKYHLQTLMV